MPFILTWTAGAERQTGTCCCLNSVTTKSLVFHPTSANATAPLCRGRRICCFSLREKKEKQRETTLEHRGGWGGRDFKHSLASLLRRHRRGSAAGLAAGLEVR